METIFKSVNVKSFKDTQIEDSKIEKILCAGMQAPLTNHQHDWEFVVTQGKKQITELAEMSPYSGPIHRAPMAITIVSNKEKLVHHIENFEKKMDELKTAIKNEDSERLKAILFETREKRLQMGSIRTVKK